ncbi:aminoglycoside phosphotransferase family protein [Nocardiopsis sp. CT-R113]|uniref:Aminoglycoside phosphotransferase family protein n=1 Tax=Nocardiopsis codii TaxID=3065942 RepID=A0ABU7KDF4_9ACTN|nr:aminoglycoside phosphotransferase family protein [Nocardiopsis sp. CT-R113]MEE2040266.1 aminoglycoside phosphotransferase family protein [Nocardiopsis sp. CT-R113]
MYEPTSPQPQISVPPALAPLLDHNFGPEWTSGLPALTGLHLRRWNLTPTGAPMHGMVALVVPVRRADGSPAVLKMQPVTEETRGEPAALRAWAGDGAVRLLDHAPATGALLLEALDPARTLENEPLDRALTVIGGLLARLTRHRAPEGTRRLGTITRTMVRRCAALAPHLRDPRDRTRLAALASHAREMASEPGDRLLHWDLHYANVLAPLPGTRPEPWVAIDPQPLAGHPGYELLPALHDRWNEAVATGDPLRETRRRFDLLTETAGIDRDRARAWTRVRVLQECVWAIEDGGTALPDVPVAVADALRDRPSRRAKDAPAAPLPSRTVDEGDDHRV